MIKDNALQSAFNNFKNMLSEENKKGPRILDNLLTGRGWNEGISSYGGKLVMPIPQKDFQNNNNKVLQQYYSRDSMGEQNAKIPSSFQAKTVQYPNILANNNGKSNPALFQQLYEKAFSKNPNVPLKVASVQEPPMKPITTKQAPIANTIQSQVTQQKTSTPTFKFQNEINQASQSSGLDMNSFHLLRAGENQAENPEAINDNWSRDGKKIVSKDVGLFQISVPLYNQDGTPNPNANAEIERLKNPVYNATRAADIFKSRMNLLKDPVLAIASYNLGAGGAVLNPEAALKRAEWVYWKAGVEMPQTEFTKNPLGYVRQNMDYYRKLGLFK